MMCACVSRARRSIPCGRWTGWRSGSKDWMTTLEILAPMDGWCAPLQEVPDQVFAGRMLGDGMAIDPVVGLVTAPCAGEVVTVAAGGHAVSIRTAGGIEVLVHVGIDTVQLGGRGFEVLVRQGQSVAVGDR